MNYITALLHCLKGEYLRNPTADISGCAMRSSLLLLCLYPSLLFIQSHNERSKLLLVSGEPHFIARSVPTVEVL